MDAKLLEKYDNLKKRLSSYGSLAVAYSGGVDSTFLLYAAKEALGEKAVAVTIASDLIPDRELTQARAYCESLGVRHFVIEADELAIEGFAENPPDRCYICKRELFTKILQLAEEQGLTAVAEGSNLDDNGDYRPGMRAIAEMGIRSPLREVGFTKQEIRNLSQHLGIPTWDKPSYACLASRIPYGDIIDREKLRMVERAEQLLMDMGYARCRVRVHGRVARIELDPDDFERFMEQAVRETVYTELKKVGFDYVTLDLLGYRTGSLNETLQDQKS